MSASDQDPQARRIRVAVADDHDLVREGFVALLSSMQAIEVVLSVADGMELLEKVGRTTVDLVMTDMAMPTVSGIEVIRNLRRTDPGIKVLVVSMDDTGTSARQAIDEGAAGYLLKTAGAVELDLAIRSVMAGSVYLSPRVARALVEPVAAEPETPLTDRQRQVLALLASGKSSKEIGFELSLSSKTVDVHRARVMERLGLRDVASLTRYALKKGLVR